MLDAFLAFNANAASYLGYTFVNNAWYFVMVLAAAVMTVFSVKNAIDITIPEEQNIL